MQTAVRERAIVSQAELSWSILNPLQVEPISILGAEPPCASFHTHSPFTTNKILHISQVALPDLSRPQPVSKSNKVQHKRPVSAT